MGICGILLLFVNDVTVLGVSERTGFETIIGEFSRFVRESIVRGDAAGDGTAGGKYGL